MERHWLASHQLLTFYQPAPNPRICGLFFFHSQTVDGFKTGSYRRISQENHLWKCRMGVQHIDPIFVLGRVLLIEIVA
jgi:hypothetical protein